MHVKTPITASKQRIKKCRISYVISCNECAKSLYPRMLVSTRIKLEWCEYINEAFSAVIQCAFKHRINNIPISFVPSVSEIIF